MISPSFLAMGVSGILIFIAFIYFIKNRDKIGSIQLINLLLFFSSAIAFHGILHMGGELFYNFNPLEGKFKWQRK